MEIMNDCEISVTECGSSPTAPIMPPMNFTERRNSKIEALKESFIATGANFRPPFTPSNSLMSPPLCKARLLRAKALDSGSPIRKTQTTVPQSPSPRRTREDEQEIKRTNSSQRKMRSSSLRPSNQRNGGGRDFISPGSVSSTQYSMRASSSNVSDASTPSSNRRFAHVKSRVDANNTTYTPAASRMRIFNQPLRLSAQSRVGSLVNANHVPAGGNVKIEHHRLTFKNAARPRIDAKSTAEIPKSEKKILSQRLAWKAESRVGSMANAGHRPAGGNVKIFHQPLRLDAVQSKIGSLNNAGHVAGGGDVKISDYKVRSTSRPSGDGSDGSANSSRRSSSAYRQLINGTANLQIAG